jgi:hypothetical protein
VSFCSNNNTTGLVGALTILLHNDAMHDNALPPFLKMHQSSVRTSVEWLAHRLARDDARGLHLDEAAADAGQRARAIDGLAQCVKHTAQGAGANWDVDDLARAVDQVTLVDGMILAKDDNTHMVVLQVECHALDTAVKAHKLTSLHAAQAIHACDTITHAQHATKVDDRRLVALLPLLDSGDELLADVLDEVLAAKLGPPHLIQGLGLSSKALQCVRAWCGSYSGQGLLQQDPDHINHHHSNSCCCNPSTAGRAKRTSPHRAPAAAWQGPGGMSLKEWARRQSGEHLQTT